MNSVAVLKRAALVCAVLLSSSTLLMAQAGSLDPTFGTGGLVTTTFGGENSTIANATAIQSDGKILVAGLIPNSQGFGEPGVARYNTDGSLDSSFGTGGIVVTTEASPVSLFGIAIQSDGRIVVGGGAFLAVDAIRYNTNGGLDKTFGKGGVASVRPFAPNNFGAGTGGLALQPDGKILVAAADALVRFQSNGQVDSSFGSGGVAALASKASTMALLSTGKVLVLSAFNSLAPSSTSSGAIMRYNSNGSLDTTFGINGQAAGAGPASGITVLSNGKFIVASSFITSASVPPAATNFGLGLTRYNSNGTIDTTFGTHGGVVTPFAGNTNAAAFALAIQSNGDIVAAGQAGSQPPDGPSSFALARYTPNGQLDASFGTNGTVTTAFESNTAFVSALAIQSDGKIVAVGNDETFSGEGQSVADSFALARYLAQ